MNYIHVTSVVSHLNLGLDKVLVEDVGVNAEELGNLLAGGRLVLDGLVILGALLLELEFTKLHHNRGDLGTKKI